jgi:hypothetical protein
MALARPLVAVLAACVFASTIAAAQTPVERCDDVQATEQIPTDLALCAQLEPIVRKPGALPSDQYQVQLNRFLGAMCHRNSAAGWKRDKTVRDSGPFTARLVDGKWVGTYAGTHSPLLIWYSPDMIAWLRANRPADPAKTPVTPAPIPDGAIMVKELYSPPPSASCRIDNLLRLRPDTKGYTVMIRDNAAAHDGWYWAGLGQKGWEPDWPPPLSNAPSLNGFGGLCVVCHASARDNQTFASLVNLEGEPGDYLTFLVQNFFEASPRVPETPAPVKEATALPPIDTNAFITTLRLAGTVPSPPTALVMPSQSYDHTWIGGGAVTPASTFVTSDQCASCHSAGGTFLQFDMTAPAPDNKLINLSPYGIWRTSPMGLAGRDPVFFAQLASETQSFHPSSAAMIEDTCLGCHGVQGERQAAIDRNDESCPEFARQTVDAVPVPSTNPDAPLAPFGALARDGVSCTTCHRMVVGQAASAKVQDAPQNRCVAQRQERFNPGSTGFARSFTGSFLVGTADQVYGPFADPKKVPMQNALGITPMHSATITSSELCSTCHTVHLPVMHNGATIGHTYEQATYPEWAFSAYRTGATPDGPLPGGAGATPLSCQDCHMPKADSQGIPFRGKIASILEHSNFPVAENRLPASDIDLPVRSGVARHTLVGLNFFLVAMAKQFSDILGIATEDPSLGPIGVPAVDVTSTAILDQAAQRTAAIAVREVRMAGATLSAAVTVTNKSGHKFPSGVSFRRAFVDFRVLDAAGKTLWESGRTNEAGVITGQNSEPVAGEIWWKPDCSARLTGTTHQPHYQVITHQDQVQIYQELNVAPLQDAKPGQCDVGAAAQQTAQGDLTTSFLSICGRLKDNRLLPEGFLPLPDRISIARALGAGEDLARDTSPVGVGDDPDYRQGGGDTFRFEIPLADIPGQAAAVEAVLYYQATPPFFLQDRFCTAKGADRDRLAYVSARLNLANTPAADWKLRLVSSGRVTVSP